MPAAAAVEDDATRTNAATRSARAVLDPRRGIVTLPPRVATMGRSDLASGRHFLDSIDEISEVVSWRFQGFAPSEVSPGSGRIVAQLCAPRPSHRAHARTHPS